MLRTPVISVALAFSCACGGAPKAEHTTTPRQEVVVLDPGSLPDSVALAEELKPGFRTHIWGDPIPKGAIKRREQETPPFVGYDIPGERLAIGHVKLDELVFLYYEGKLCAVRAQSTDPRRRPLLLDTLQAAWGRGEVVRGDASDPSDFGEWEATHPAHGKTTARYGDISEFAVLVVQSERLYKEATTAPGDL